MPAGRDTFGPTPRTSRSVYRPAPVVARARLGCALGGRRSSREKPAESGHVGGCGRWPARLARTVGLIATLHRSVDKRDSLLSFSSSALREARLIGVHDLSVRRPLLAVGHSTSCDVLSPIGKISVHGLVKFILSYQHLFFRK
jgi:hypothetical protein